MENRWLTFLTMNMEMSNVFNAGNLAAVPCSTNEWIKQREAELGGKQISFLHTEAPKVSQKPVVSCIMWHILVSYARRDWRADPRLCGLTKLSCSSLLNSKVIYVVWLCGKSFDIFTILKRAQPLCRMCCSIPQLQRNHVEVSHRVESVSLFTEVWLSSATKKSSQCEMSNSNIVTADIRDIILFSCS